MVLFLFYSQIGCDTLMPREDAKHKSTGVSRSCSNEDLADVMNAAKRFKVSLHQLSTIDYKTIGFEPTSLLLNLLPYSV